MVNGSLHYATPRKTLVFVFSNNLVTIDIGSISNVPALGVSLPISVSLGEISPYSDLNITFNTITNNTNVVFVPPSLSFVEGVSLGYFQINYTTNDTNGTVVFNYTLSGTDAASFSTPAQSNFAIEILNTLAPTITQFSIGIKDEITANISITVGTPSNVYWIFLAYANYLKNATLATLDYVTSVTAPIVGTTNANQTSTGTQVNEYLKYLPNANSYSDWASYVYDLSYYAQTTNFTGAMFVLAAAKTTLYAFDSLVAGTEYIAFAWADNLSGNTAASANATGTTTAIPSPVVSSLTFDIIITGGQVNTITQGYCKSLGASVMRCASFSGITTSRRLSSGLQVIVSGSPSDKKSPATLVAGFNSARFISNLASSGITVGSASQTVVATPVYSTAGLTNTTYNDTANVVYFYYTTGGVGILCFVVESNPNTSLALTSQMIYQGFGRDGLYATVSACADEPESTTSWYSINFTALNVSHGTYVISTTACNNYPITPTCISDSLIANYTYNYGNANSLIVMLFALLAYLV